MQKNSLKKIISRYNLMFFKKDAFEKIKTVIPLLRRIKSNDIKHLLNNSEIQSLKTIGSIFQLTFVLNKIFSISRIKNLSFILKVE